MVYYVTYGNTNIVMPFPVPQLLNVNVFDLGSNSLTFSQASLDFIMTFSFGFIFAVNQYGSWTQFWSRSEAMTNVNSGILYYVYMGMLAVFCTNAINILAGKTLNLFILVGGIRYYFIHFISRNYLYDYLFEYDSLSV